MQKLATAILVSVFVVPSGAFAHPGCGTSNGQTCSAVQPADSPKVSGPLRAAATSEAALLGSRLAASSTREAQGRSAQRSWAARHPVLLGTLVGFGAGLGFFAVACRDCDSSSDSFAYGTLMLGYGGLGAGVGAGVGYALSR